MAVLWDQQLADLSGLSRLKSVPSDVMLSGLPALTSLGQLSGLGSVGLNLVISDNAGLKDLSGLGECVGWVTLEDLVVQPRVSVPCGCMWV